VVVDVGSEETGKTFKLKTVPCEIYTWVGWNMKKLITFVERTIRKKKHIFKIMVRANTWPTGTPKHLKKSTI
jgi:hypothetical protein